MWKSFEARNFLVIRDFYERKFMEIVQKLCESLCIPIVKPFVFFLAFLCVYFDLDFLVYFSLLRVVHIFLFITF